ncbi:MAG: hypothetical protein HY049_17490 [Acidobacteria bacterium]|nr:hypothetical protein [Acidobacteriota bacterium]
MARARNQFTRRIRRLGRKLILGSGPDRYRLGREIWLDQVFGRTEDELRILGALADSEGTGVDVGAHRGHYSYVTSKSFGRVVDFEPNAALVRDLAGSALGNVAIHCCALSSRARRARLHTPLQHGVDLSGWASLEMNRVPG